MDEQDIQDFFAKVGCPFSQITHKPAPDHRPSLPTVLEPHVLFFLFILCILCIDVDNKILTRARRPVAAGIEPQSGNAPGHGLL